MVKPESAGSKLARGRIGSNRTIRSVSEAPALHDLRTVASLFVRGLESLLLFRNTHLFIPYDSPFVCAFAFLLKRNTRDPFRVVCSSGEEVAVRRATGHLHVRFEAKSSESTQSKDVRYFYCISKYDMSLSSQKAGH